MKYQYTVGIDLGGTNTAFGIADASGKIVSKGTMPTTGHESVAAYVLALNDRIAPLMEQVGKGNIAGVGIGAPNGNYFTGKIEFAPNLPWSGVIPLAQMVSDALGLKAWLTNDAKAAAIGEMTYGAARGMNDFVMVTLGTGLGSGIVSNGKMIYGHDGLAGELGHIIAERNGRKCNCGRKGCLERYASATGIVLTAEEWLAERKDATTLQDANGKLTARMIQEAAFAGDTFAIALYDYTARILGQSLADVVALTSPEAIIFFGGLANAGPLLLEPLQKYLEYDLLSIYQRKVKLLLSQLADADAAILGACAMAWE